jgi:hypothetical protein
MSGIVLTSSCVMMFYKITSSCVMMFYKITSSCVMMFYKITSSDRKVVGFTTILVKSVPITTNVVSSNPAHGEVYSIQHCVIKFVSALREVCGSLRVLRFPPFLQTTRGQECLVNCKTISSSS